MTHFDENKLQTKRHRPPEEMSESERDQEVATLFARGILRLQTQRSLTNPTSKEFPKSPREGLELSGEMRLSGTVG